MSEKTETRKIEHNGRTFELAQTEPHVWAITDVLTGATYGHLVLIHNVGEDGMPVYGGALVGHEDPFIDGNDWPDIVRALINQVDSGFEP